MRPLRVLLVTHGYKPAYRLGGPIESVAALAEGLVKRGHRVTVFATDSNLDQDLDVETGRPFDIDGVEVWYFKRWKVRIPGLPKAKSIGYLYAPAMSRVMAQRISDFDLLHTQLPFIYPTLAASRVAARHRKAHFYHQRGVFAPERLKFRGFKKRLYLERVERPILQRASCLIALTAEERRDYEALAPGVPCRVLPNGIDCARFRTEPRSSTPMGLPENAVVILFMGRLHPIKGGDVLLEAFLKICDRHPDAHLVLAGPDEWQLESRYRMKAARYLERIHFPGMVSGEQKLDLLARADVFCLPSVAEGFSMAVLEAMASGAAVLLSPGCRFAGVVDADAGVVAENSVAETATALERLLSAPADIFRMGMNGRSLVERDYRWETIVSGMENIYREFIEGEGTSR